HSGAGAGRSAKSGHPYRRLAPFASSQSMSHPGDVGGIRLLRCFTPIGRARALEGFASQGRRGPSTHTTWAWGDEGGKALYLAPQTGLYRIRLGICRRPPLSERQMRCSGGGIVPVVPPMQARGARAAEVEEA